MNLLPCRDKRTRELMASSNNTPAPEGTGTPDPSGQPGAAGADSSFTAGEEGNSEPPLKRARSSSGIMDDGGEGTPGPGRGCCMVESHWSCLKGMYAPFADGVVTVGIEGTSEVTLVGRSSSSMLMKRDKGPHDQLTELSITDSHVVLGLPFVSSFRGITCAA